MATIKVPNSTFLQKVPEDGVHGQVAEEVLVLAENLTAEGGASNVHEVFPGHKSSSSWPRTSSHRIPGAHLCIYGVILILPRHLYLCDILLWDILL